MQNKTEIAKIINQSLQKICTYCYRCSEKEILYIFFEIIYLKNYSKLRNPL